jgi:hypothetical protein
MDASQGGLRLAFTAEFTDVTLPSDTVVPVRADWDTRRGPELQHVRFSRADGTSWVAAIPGGSAHGPYSAILPTPDEWWACVVVSGRAYFINVTAPGVFIVLRVEPICQALPVPSEYLVLATYTELAFYFLGQDIWTTPRLAYEGIRDLRVEGAMVIGQGWSAPLGKWVEFAADSRMRSVSGGGYP